MTRISNPEIRRLNQILFDNNVDLELFEIDTRSEELWKITHKPILLYFKIIKRDNDYHLARYFSDKKLIPPLILENFDDVIIEFKKWVIEIWNDIQTDINPIKSRQESFSKIINKISPEFSKIYNQGLRGESAGLNEISGFGFRKALEFLIKDYLIFKTPEDQHEFIIQHPSIVSCMKKFPRIIDENILGTGERAFWLGNDHSHYYKRHESMTIENLKELVSLTIHWIEQKEKSDNYKKLLP